MNDAAIFKPTPGARLSQKDAQTVGRVLTGISDRDGGRLSPAAVVAEAKSKKSPLHRYFTWDNSAAAEAYRLNEARQLIRSVTVFVRREPEKPMIEVRAFVSVRPEEKNYMPIVTVMSDAQMRQQLLAKAFLELQAFRKRYSTFSELAGVFEAMDALPVGKVS